MTSAIESRFRIEAEAAAARGRGERPRAVPWPDAPRDIAAAIAELIAESMKIAPGEEPAPGPGGWCEQLVAARRAMRGGRFVEARAALREAARLVVLLDAGRSERVAKLRSAGATPLLRQLRARISANLAARRAKGPSPAARFSAPAADHAGETDARRDERRARTEAEFAARSSVPVDPVEVARYAAFGGPALEAARKASALYDRTADAGQFVGSGRPAPSRESFIAADADVRRHVAAAEPDALVARFEAESPEAGEAARVAVKAHARAVRSGCRLSLADFVAAQVARTKPSAAN
jgi:hypothetical protein